MCIKKKPAKLVSIICTARNGQFISMLYGIIIFFLPYVHLFKNCWQWFLSIYEKLESIITVSHKAHFVCFGFCYFIFRLGVLLLQHLAHSVHNAYLTFLYNKTYEKWSWTHLSLFWGRTLEVSWPVRSLSLSTATILFVPTATCVWWMWP